MNFRSLPKRSLLSFLSFQNMWTNPAEFERKYPGLKTMICLGTLAGGAGGLPVLSQFSDVGLITL